METFEALKAYQMARDYRREIAQLISQFPKEEKYRLTDQMAEGYGRFHYQETIQSFRISRASLDEVHEHLNVALDEGYMDEDQNNLMIERKYKIMQLINGYIRYLDKSKRQ